MSRVPIADQVAPATFKSAGASASVFTRMPAHDRFRDRLTALATDDLLLGAMTESCRRCEWWPSGAEWTRTYGRFDPGGERFVTVVFETTNEPQVILCCEVFESRPDDKVSAEFCVDLGPVGWLRCFRFPFDPELTTLPKLLEGLSASGETNQTRSQSAASVIRYRPLKRCTIRHEKDARAFFIKIFHDQRGARFHEAGLELWRASEKGELQFKVARPIRWDPLTKSLWQEELKGNPATPMLFSERGRQLARRVGRAMASLNCSGVKLEAISGPEEQLLRTQRHAFELSAIVPRCTEAANQLIEKLSRLHQTVGARRLKPIHGSPHRRQWLEDGEHLSLVDLDGVSLGDPEMDAAVFITNLEYENVLKVPIRALVGEFVAGYESVGGSLDRKLLNAYRAHGWLLKALRSARAIRPDGHLRAEKRLSYALQCLEEEVL